MAVTNFSPLLGLALPATGDLSGTWGTTVNTSITSLIDSAVAGTTTLSADTDVTLTTTDGAANQARSAILLCTGARTTLKTITAPAQSKAYIVINATTGGFSVKVVGSGPTTPGVTVPNGEKALIAWNGSDFVMVSSSVIDLTTEVTGLLPIVNGGTGTSSTTFANLATNVTGTLPVANGGTGTATPNLVQGTNVTISGTWPNQTINAAGAAQVYPGAGIAVSTGSAWTTSKTSPSGDIVGTTDTQTLTNKTLVAPLLGTPTSGTLSACTVDGTTSVGFRTIPQNAQTTAYELVLADSGKHIYMAVAQAATTITIPANSSVAYPIGTAISFVNMSTNAMTIAITTDTMYSSTGTTGSRTLAQYGSATALKMTSTTWLITGSNLT